MNILSETEKTVYDLECEFTEEEMNRLLNYGKTFCPEEELNRFYINWAMVKAITTYIDENNNTDTDTDTDTTYT